MMMRMRMIRIQTGTPPPPLKGGGEGDIYIQWTKTKSHRNVGILHRGSRGMVTVRRKIQNTYKINT